MAVAKCRIVVHDDAIELYEPNDSIRWRVRSSEIVEIAAWKDDVFAYDIICFGFRIDGAEKYLACDEEADGWDELQEFVKNRFGIKLEDWFDRVAFPAFVPNFITIWGTPIIQNKGNPS